MITTITTTTVTQNQALCMFFGVEHNSNNVIDCKKKVPWTTKGYAGNHGDQLPLTLSAKHFCRDSTFVKYAEDEKTAVVKNRTDIKRRTGKYG